MVHLLCTLPLACWIGQRIPLSGRWLGTITGLILALATIIVGAPVGTAIGEASGWQRFAIRFCWCLILQIPWTVTAPNWINTDKSALFLSIALATSLPWLFATDLVGSATRQLSRLIEERRFTEASYPLAALAGIGANLPSGEPSRPALNQLLREQKRLEGVTKSGTPFERAEALLSLARNADADSILKVLPPSPRNLLLLGIARQRLGDFRSSDEALNEALVLSEGSIKIEIIDHLARNAHEMGRHVDAERLYLDWFKKSPAHAGYLAMQLARHYHAGNRVVEALNWLDKAAELEPAANQSQAESLRGDILRTTPGCLLEWWKNSSQIN